MLQRLARTMYRRRRTVLAAWIVAADRHVRGRRRARRRVPHRVQVARLREPGRVRPAEAVRVQHPQRRAGPDRVRGAPGRHRPGRARPDGEAVPRDPADGEQTPASSAPTRRRARARSPRAAASRTPRSTSPTATRTRSFDAGDQIKSLTDRVQVPGLHVALGGDLFEKAAPGGVSEGVGIFAAMVILLIAFGSVLAMGLPIGTALFGVGTGVGLVLIVRTRDRHAELHDRGGRDGRHRRRHRLRAVHGDPVPGESRRTGSDRKPP